MSAKILEYGAWPSPIVAEDVARGSRRLGQLALDGGDIYWSEGRPTESGRTTVMNESGEVLAAPWDLRSRVHEYGGGAYAVHRGELWFANAETQAIYHSSPDTEPREYAGRDGWAFADLQLDAKRQRLICVAEVERENNQPQAHLVAVSPRGIQTLAAGRDFYASPRLSPEGDSLVWLAWDQPDMPWNGCELWRADIEQHGGLSGARGIAGGPDESLFQPQFAPGGDLYVVSDANGWWNIHRVTDDGLVPVTDERAEFGQPQWVFGQSTYGFDAAGKLYAIFTCDGLWQLARITPDGRPRIFDLPFTHYEQLKVGPDYLAFNAADATTAPGIYRMGTDGGAPELLRSTSESVWEPADLSAPEVVEFATSEGDTAYGLYYPPVNSRCRGPADAKPPLLVKCHGGPTGATGSALEPKLQFWTSRGFAVLDVNYRGSTGYGRAYRELLHGRWGVYDVDDCVYGAWFLVEQGLADESRLCISGSSAGGYTVLCALAFRDAFAAGASYYGIGDLAGLLETTHKFEARYFDRLIGPWPQAETLYRARSPLLHADRFDCPVIFLQGLKDKVVPSQQAADMAAALRAKGLPVALLEFPEERHGFRQAANIRASLEAELYFYGRILGFTPADDLTAIDIDNL